MLNNIKKNIKLNFDKVNKKTNFSFFEEKMQQIVSIGSNKNIEFDTMHYFLIPNLDNYSDFHLHTFREVPENPTTNSKIVKKKIFHIPNKSYINEIYNKALDIEKNKNLEDKFKTSSIIKNISIAIDEKNENISNALILSGVTLLLANPIVGFAFIGSSFVPNFLSKFTNDLSKNMEVVESEKELEKVKEEFKKVDPEIEINSVLYKFYESLKNEDFEPILDIKDSDRTRLLTFNAIKPFYDDKILKKKGFLSNEYFYRKSIVQYYKILHAGSI